MRTRRLGFILTVLVIGRVVGADGMVVQQFAAGSGSAHPGSVKITDAGDGAAIIRADLSAVPKGAKVYHARLLVERQVDPASPDALTRCEVYPLKAAFEAGKAPSAEGKPLEIPAPAYDFFDATGAAARWVADPDRNFGLLVKSIPGWNRESTRLEVAWEGRPISVPRQASGLKVVHHAGQTFITWREVDPLLAGEQAAWGDVRKALAEAGAPFRYRVYVHDKPITAKTLASATLLGEVGPLSCWNVNGRSVEYLIGDAMANGDEIGELAQFHNHLTDTWHMDHPRMDRCPIRRLAIPSGDAKDPARPATLPPGSGLFVHHPQAGRRYYAVASGRDGTVNTIDFTPANALAEPIVETAGAGEPIHQGEGLWGPFFDYPGRRQVYVQWAAPPLAPRPNMYFNWSVLVPPGTKGPVPCELSFHRDNYSYAKPQRKVLIDSIQIAPHDWPFSGWVGYNPAAGTLASPADAVVGRQTQDRILAFMDWAKKAFPIDPRRVIGMGREGAVLMAAHKPDLFAYVLVNDFDGEVLKAESAGKFAAAWGPKGPQVKDAAGRGDWAWGMLDAAVPTDGTTMPLIVCKGYSWGRFSTGWGKGHGRFYKAMHEARQPIFADWTWAGGQLHVPDKYTGVWRGLDITADSMVPALANSSLDSDREANGQTNMAYTWKDAGDTPEALEITLINNGGDATADLTPRRFSRFKAAPGEKLSWRAENVAADRRVATRPVQGGQVVVAADGTITLAKLNIPGRTGLAIRIEKTK